MTGHFSLASFVLKETVLLQTQNNFTMGMDRNTVIGFILIGLLMFGMFYFNSKNQKEWEANNKRYNDSIAALKPKPNKSVSVADSLRADSLHNLSLQGGFSQLANAPAQVVEVENEVMKIAISTKGAQPQKVVLKSFKKFDGTQLVLQESKYNKFSYTVNTGVNQIAETGNIIFEAKPVVKNADGSQVFDFVAKDSAGRQITHSYVLKPNEYRIGLTINITGAQNMFTGNVMAIDWQTETPQLEKDHAYEKLQTNICYVADGEFDFKRLGKEAESDSKSFSDPVNWVGVRQQFFTTVLEPSQKFTSANLNWQTSADTTNYLVRTSVLAKVQVPAANTVSVPLNIYYGPSDYNILSKYGNNLKEMVPYGSGMFSFVKYINRHLLLPAFDFLKGHFASMGIVILLLTLLIRLITSPILYNSYYSGAKMRVLKPEVDELRAKHINPKTGELDQQAFSMAQMQLWRSAGVNPMQGCIPALLQIPIFMSLYYFFQGNVDLRGQGFLWANDLAAYDNILSLPFKIPFYGNHVSLFALLATLTSFLISLYSMNQMQDQSNPVMKYMPYFFPVMMLFFFNTLPSALTWYYTVSNTITLILQFVIQNYIINHDKILAQINENKKKPPKVSKLQERIQAMQEQQKKLQEMKEKSNKGK